MSGKWTVRTVFKREAEQQQQAIKPLCPNSVNGHYKTEAMRGLGVLQERPQCAELVFLDNTDRECAYLGFSYKNQCWFLPLLQYESANAGVQPFSAV